VPPSRRLDPDCLHHRPQPGVENAFHDIALQFHQMHKIQARQLGPQRGCGLHQLYRFATARAVLDLRGRVGLQQKTPPGLSAANTLR